MSTLHRRDIDFLDLQRLARFCRALQILKDESGHLPWILGTVEMWLPLWYSAGKDWKFSKFRPFHREAFGIPTASMRRICRYLGIRESELIHLLFRLSMLAVTPKNPTSEDCLYRMPFTGVPIDRVALTLPEGNHGFVIERRRAEGHFREVNTDPFAGGR